MDQNTSEIASSNPLATHFRQPAIYFKLPGQGKWWPKDALVMPQNSELGVLSMTTKDEITLKTPDALLNGQGVVNVIESCCPDIKDAWKMPSTDVDACLIAVRIATYGNQMDFTSTCPHCSKESEYAIDLGHTLSSISPPDWDIPLSVDGLKIKVYPQAYFNVNKSNMIAFEEQQILRSLQDIADNPEENKPLFDKHLSKVIELNTLFMANSTRSIETETGEVVTDPKHIFEFYSNASNDVVRKIKNYISELNEQSGVDPVKVNCNNEECGKEFEITISFDYASFFVEGS